MSNCIKPLICRKKKNSQKEKSSSEREERPNRLFLFLSLGAVNTGLNILFSRHLGVVWITAHAKLPHNSSVKTKDQQMDKKKKRVCKIKERERKKKVSFSANTFTLLPSRTDAEQLCEHQAGSGEADEEDTLGRPGLQTAGPVDDGGLPVRAGET